MMPLVAQLSEQQKMMLFTTNRKDNGGMGLLLNLLLTSLGSWVQGDVSGALTELSMALAGGLCMAGGISEYYDYYYGYYYYDYNSLFYVGVALIATNVVYMCIRPFQFVKQWNQNLATALQVPYIALLDAKENTFTIAPAGDGLDWRFGLNLVSIEY